MRSFSVASLGMRPRGAGGTCSSWPRRPVAAGQLAFLRRLKLGLGAVPGVDERLLGAAAGVLCGLVEHLGVVQRVRGVAGDVGGSDDLVFFVHDGLGVDLVFEPDTPPLRRILHDFISETPGGRTVPEPKRYAIEAVRQLW